MSLKQFLLNPNRKFKDGLALYNTVKTSREYDDFFNNAGDPPPGTVAFNILDKQIHRALRKQENSQPDTPPQQTPQKPTSPPVKHQAQNTAPKPPIQVKTLIPQAAKKTVLIDMPELKNVNDLPEHIRNAYFENKRLFTEIAGASRRMAACNSNEERQPIAQEIAALNKRKEQNWKEINAYKEGKTPDEPETPAVTLDPAKEALKISRRISTVKINISRAQKEINSGKLKGKKLETRLASLSNWENELMQLEGKLPR